MSSTMRGRLRFAAASAATLAAAWTVAGVAAAEPAPPYQDLWAQAQANAPRLSEAAAAVKQAEGLSRQAGVRPNPTLGVEVENFSGSGPFHGTSSAEMTFSIEQPLELGGKRGARISAGRASVDAARAQLTQARADYAFDLASAYADADAAERRVELAQEGFALAQEDLRAAKALVSAGKEAELRGLQAKTAVTSAQAALNAAEAERTGALARLTALAGSQIAYTSVAEDLLARRRPASSSASIDPLSVPAVIAAQAEREAASRRVRVEQTKAIPDVNTSVGIRRLNDFNATAMVAGLSVPIPVFDQNRGAISAARAELTAAEARLNAARLNAEADLRTGLFQLSAAQTREAAALEGESTAVEAHRLTRIAYEAGKSSLIELITARRALADARNLTIEAQLARLRAEAGLARLEGRAPFGVRQP